MGDKTPGDDGFPEPRRLRQLRRLVTALTATLIVGVIAIVGAACHPPRRAAGRPLLPAELRLPAGESARAVTLGTGWVAVVTVDGAGRERIRVLDAATGEPRGLTEIAPAP